MAFPQDFSDVVCIKIHPAIGIARVSKNDEHFVFGTDPSTYKSNGLMKRQAVQYRLFAYGRDDLGLGELTPELLESLGVSAVWSASVANRKLRFTAKEPDWNLPDAEQRVFSASASSDDARQGRLEASLPGFAEGALIPLGQITPTGLFVPPKAGVFREVPRDPVPSYPDFTPRIADTTSDGVIRVILGGPAQNIPILPAWIVVAPGDYSPDVDPAADADESLLVLLSELLGPASDGGSPHNDTARRLDETAIRPASADFAPGFETSLSRFNRSEVADIKSLFYDRTDPLIGAGEMRIRPRGTSDEAGAFPGMLTSGLCSPWQSDFTACVGYWSENLPLTAFLDEADQTPVRVYRKRYADISPSAPRLVSGDDFERHQDKIGIVRIRNGKPIETERGPGDDISDAVS